MDSEKVNLWTRLTRPCFSFAETGIFLAVVIAIACLVSWQNISQQEILVRAALRSPLAEVELAKSGPRLSGEETYAKPYQFTQDWFTSNIPIWKAALADYQGKPDVHYLEIGLYEGRSSLWMLEHVLTAPTSTITGIDVFDGELRERFFANLEQSGVAKDRYQIIVAPSQVVMRTLPLEHYDIIYIDGSHATADVMEDAVLSYRLLKTGGILIFDDYLWMGAIKKGELTHDADEDFPKLAIDRFVESFADRLDVIHNGYQLILKKK